MFFMLKVSRQRISEGPPSGFLPQGGTGMTAASSAHVSQMTPMPPPRCKERYSVRLKVWNNPNADYFPNRAALNGGHSRFRGNERDLRASYQE
jgi:hypothetical protein